MPKASNLRPGDPGYVGRGHPPAEHQYKKGVSGNPAGRPKGRHKFMTELADEFDRTIALPNGKRVSLAMLFASSLLAQISRADDIKPLELSLRLMERLDSGSDSEEATLLAEDKRGRIDAALARMEAARASDLSDSAPDQLVADEARAAEGKG